MTMNVTRGITFFTVAQSDTGRSGSSGDLAHLSGKSGRPPTFRLPGILTKKAAPNANPGRCGFCFLKKTETRLHLPQKATLHYSQVTSFLELSGR